jgi:hypothetical protein
MLTRIHENHDRSFLSRNHPATVALHHCGQHQRLGDPAFSGSAVRLRIDRIATSPPSDIDISLDKYRLLIAKEWDKLSSAGYIKQFKPIYNNKGWAKYMMKEITTTNTDVIDEVTTHLN